MSQNVNEDKGSQFKLSSPEFRLLIRKRSNTFPSTPNCSNFMSPAYEDSDEDSTGPVNTNVFTPTRNTQDINKTFGRQQFISSQYRSPRFESPLTPNSPDIGHREPNTSSDQFGFNPILSQSLVPSVSSPLSSLMTPMSLFNSPHLPQIRYLSYSPMYRPMYNNFDYNSTHFYNHSDRVMESAKQHRNAATHAEARHTWSGTLPNGSHKTPIYSSKVFLGGVPWEMTDHDIKLTFSRFGNVTILRPGQHVRLSRSSQNKDKAGYLYLIFESDKQVKSLINACTHDFSNGGKYYFALNQSRYRPKDVQIIPWNTNDTSYVKIPSARVDATKTVFVGALHGMLTAEGLACILEDLFGGVVYVGIDTDKYKYPIGSGRVTFSTTKAYNKAVQAAFIDVKSNRFQKKIQIDPFLEETNCSQCRSEKGPIFCRDVCMTYFCRTCWDVLHSTDPMRGHQPIMRNKSKF